MTERHPRFDEALALHRRHPVVDGHADSILQVLEGKRSLVERSDQGHLDFPRAREGGCVEGDDPGDYRRVADHVDHAVQLVGPDHVGYGSDFDGTNRLPRGLEDVSHLPNLTAELLDRGYDEPSLAKILGGNYLRVFERVFGA